MIKTDIFANGMKTVVLASVVMLNVLFVSCANTTSNNGSVSSDSIGDDKLTEIADTFVSVEYRGVFKADALLAFYEGEAIHDSTVLNKLRSYMMNTLEIDNCHFDKIACEGGNYVAYYDKKD